MRSRTVPDWEVELGVVIGRPVRHVGVEEARAAIAGYTIVNDITMRDWQRRTVQWLQGKTFESTTPVGPFLVTGDEVGDALDLEVRCEVDGEVMQQDRTSELVFGPAECVAYASEVITLEPGDIISTGTTGGVGWARTPPLFLRPGQQVADRRRGAGRVPQHLRRRRGLTPSEKDAPAGARERGAVLHEGQIAEGLRYRGDGGDLVDAYIARPLGSGLSPGVVVIHHAPGWDEATKEITRRFAHHGYAAAIAPTCSPARGVGTTRTLRTPQLRREPRAGSPTSRVLGDVDAATWRCCAPSPGPTA